MTRHFSSSVLFFFIDVSHVIIFTENAPGVFHEKKKFDIV